MQAQWVVSKGAQCNTQLAVTVTCTHQRLWRERPRRTPQVIPPLKQQKSNKHTHLCKPRSAAPAARKALLVLGEGEEEGLGAPWLGLVVAARVVFVCYGAGCRRSDRPLRFGSLEVGAMLWLVLLGLLWSLLLGMMRAAAGVGAPDDDVLNDNQLASICFGVCGIVCSALLRLG